MGIQTASQAIINENSNVSTFGVFRNRIQNGEININQRAVANTTNTASVINAAGIVIDRWKPEHYNIGGSFNPNLSMSQIADHPIKGSNGYCLEIKCNTTGTTANNVDFFSMSQSIEAQNISDAFSGANSPALTLSFWVKSNKTGTYCVELRDNSSSGGNYISIYEYTIIQSGVWEKKVINIPKPTYSSMVSTNVSGLGVMFHYASALNFTYDPSMAPALNAWLNKGTQGAATNNQTNLFTAAGNYHRLTDVQLEIGTTATPFERRPYSLELQLCQRYFYPIYNYNATGASTGYVNSGHVASIASTTGTNLHIKTVPMRTYPTVNFSNPSGQIGANWSGAGGCTFGTSVSYYTAYDNKMFDVHLLGFAGCTNSIATGSACTLYINSASAAAYLNFSAEL